MSRRIGIALILLLAFAPALAQVDTTWLKTHTASKYQSDHDLNLINKAKYRSSDHAIEPVHPLRLGETIHVEPFGILRDNPSRRTSVRVHNSAGAPPATSGHGAVNAIVEDFLVNDDVSGFGHHHLPAVAGDQSGDFVVVWEDQRHGNVNIYAQRYDSSGAPLGSNFKVNNDPGIVWHGFPAVAMDHSGNFVIAWSDDRVSPYSDIYAQRYDSAGSPLGSNFKVNDDPGVAYQFHPSVATDESGSFVITWDDERNGDPDIYAQTYDASGNALGSNFRVNDDGAGNLHRYPAVAMEKTGGSLITWYDSRNGQYDIYAQRYSLAGTPSGSNFKVNDDAGSAWQWLPAVAADGSGSFLIAWEDGRDGNVHIYAQKYDSSANPLGANFKVSDVAATASQGSPAVAANDSGYLVITWEDYRNGHADVYAQEYDSLGDPLGPNFRVNDDAENATQGWPCVAMDISGRFVAAWHDLRPGDSQIYVQRFGSAGTPLGINFQVNDDLGSASQSEPAAAINGSGSLVITWQDGRDGNYDVYAQRYDPAGTALDSNFKVSDDTTSAFQTDPTAATDEAGDFVITWSDYRGHNYDVYAQRYNSSGLPVGFNFRVNDDVGPDDQHSSCIGMNASGGFVVAWQDDRSGMNSDIYAQTFDSYGCPAGSNFKVNDDPGDGAWQWLPAAAMDSLGNFVITWTDDRSGILDIYAQRYWAGGIPSGSNFKVNDDLGSAYQLSPAVAMESSGDFVIAWRDRRSGDFDIYAQRHDSSGTPLGSNFRVNDDDGTAAQSSPAITLVGYDNFIIAWTDLRNGWTDPDVYAQLYDSSGNVIHSNYLVTDLAHASLAQERPAVAANEFKICFAWMDNRRAKGWDIYANIRHCHPPQAFSLLYPPNKTFTPRLVYLDWEDACNPEWCDFIGYDLHLSASSHFPADSTIIDYSIPASEYRRTLDYGHYYWKVKAKDYCGAETWSSEIRHFVVTGIPCSRGDFNSDGQIDIGDVIFALNYLFKYGSAPYPLELGDVNCDGVVDLGDVVYLINYLFKGGSPPCSL